MRKLRKEVLLCGAVLLVGAVMSAVQLAGLSLSQQEQAGFVKPDKILFAVQMPDNMTDTDARQTFSRLTDGFSRQYPNFQVDVRIYADNLPLPEDADCYFYSDSLDFAKADLSAVLQELPPANYPADFAGTEEIPLSFSIPALYYDMSDLSLLQNFAEKKQISPEDFPETTLTEHVDFSAFLQNPEKPVLATTAEMAKTEQNPAVSGRIHMLPVTENGTFPKQFHDFCSVRPESSRNKQKISMLWIEYLLSEQAQTILFSAHYGNFPVHQKAFSTALAEHQEYKKLKSMEETVYEQAT